MLKKKTSNENCFTSRKRVLSPRNVILEEFQSCHWHKYRLETQKPKWRTLAKTSSCGWFYQQNWVFSSKIFVYMPIEHYLSNSLYKSFLTMPFTIRSPMQWRPSNRKLAVCLTGNEINKAYSNMNIDYWTREFVLFCNNKNLGQHFADYRGKAFAYSGHFKNKLRVAEIDNARGRSLKMLEWMLFIIQHLFVHFWISSSLGFQRKIKRHVFLLLFVLTPVHLNWPSYATWKC